MFPLKHRCLLTIALEKITMALFVVSRVWKLEVGSAKRKQELERIVRAGPVIERRKRARALASVVKPRGLRCVQIAVALERFDIQEVTELIRMTTVVGRDVRAEIVSSPQDNASVIVGVEAGACDHVQDSAEAVAEFGGESSSNDVYRLNKFRCKPGREQLVWVVEERDSIDKRVQRELVAAQVNEVIVTPYGARDEWSHHVSELHAPRCWHHLDLISLNRGGCSRFRIEQLCNCLDGHFLIERSKRREFEIDALGSSRCEREREFFPVKTGRGDADCVAARTQSGEGKESGFVGLGSARGFQELPFKFDGRDDWLMGAAAHDRPPNSLLGEHRRAEH